MVTRYYNIYEYGFILKQSEIVSLAKTLYPYATEGMIVDDLPSFAREVASYYGLTLEECFSGTVTPLHKDGTPLFERAEQWNDALLLMVPSVNELSPTAPPTQSMKVMIHNARCYLGKAMPAEYNFADNICHVVGTTFRVNLL